MTSSCTGAPGGGLRAGSPLPLWHRGFRWWRGVLKETADEGNSRQHTHQLRNHRPLLTRPDPMPLSTGTPTVLWTLRNGAKQLTCSVQLLYHTAWKSTWPSTATGRTAAGRFTCGTSCWRGRENSASGILPRAGADPRHGATSSHEGYHGSSWRRSNGFTTASTGLKTTAGSSSSPVRTSGDPRTNGATEPMTNIPLPGGWGDFVCE